VSIIDEMCSDVTGSAYEKYGTEDFHFVRPCGNPLTTADYIEFVSGGDMSITSASLVTLHVLDVGDIMAYAVVTQAAQFKYDGDTNDDVFVATVTFKKIDGVWRIALVQRSAGRSPSEPKPEFKGFTQSGTRRYPFPFGA
jgi:ketosteroid isomerase-like protein